MVLPDSHEISRVSWYSGTSRAVFGFGYGAFTLYDAPSQTLPLPNDGSHYGGPTTPDARRRPVWALPISLAATLGISLDFFSCGY
jgi:hypothetical protein